VQRSETRESAAIAPDCAEPVIGRRFAPTRWLAMTEVARSPIPIAISG